MKSLRRNIVKRALGKIKTFIKVFNNVACAIIMIIFAASGILLLASGLAEKIILEIICGFFLLCITVTFFIIQVLGIKIE